MSAARDALDRVNRYPDPDQRAIGEAFSSWLDVPREELVFGNGASELIYAAMAAIKPPRVVVTHPTFSEYESCALALGIPSIGIPARRDECFAFDIGATLETIAGGDMLVVCQPNNPTGVAWSSADLAALISICRERAAYMLADECFINLTYPKAPSCLGMIGSGRVIVLRALTKDFSAPGLRVGFIAADAGIAGSVRKRLQPWPVNCVGEAFAIACARQPEPFLRASAEKISALRNRLREGLLDLGFEPNPSEANFILVRGAADAEEVYLSLIGRSILVRKCGNFPALGPDYFRIAVRKEAENASLLSALASTGLR
jgi:threonine-phosphate decarboxylase